jgi:uncharacterized protein (TIGR02466 family)
MVMPVMQLVPTWAVPIGTAHLPNCEALNRELEALFLARENEDHRNPTPSHIPQDELFESRFNLFRWPEPCVQRLRDFVLGAIAQTVLDTTTLRPEELARFAFHNHTWYHLTRYAGSFVGHNHPNASWSAVYCVRVGEAVPDQPDSGLLRFFDPRSGANAYADPGNSRLRPAFAFRPVELRLTAGQVVVFPSYLFHEVLPFYGADLRITVASNCWFR